MDKKDILVLFGERPKNLPRGRPLDPEVETG